MSMSKKDFVAIAAALKAIKPPRMDGAALRSWGECCQAMANVCAGHNGAFNRPRFLDACGVDND